MDLDNSISLAVYKAFIRLRLEFAMPLSAHFLPRDTQALENGQKLAVTFIKWLRHDSYKSALHRLRLFSLPHRIIRGELACLYKMAHGLLNFPWHAIFAALLSSTSRGHASKIH